MDEFEIKLFLEKFFKFMDFEVKEYEAYENPEVLRHSTIRNRCHVWNPRCGDGAGNCHRQGNE